VDDYVPATLETHLEDFPNLQLPPLAESTLKAELQ
jgi:hypothetical protein